MKKIARSVADGLFVPQFGVGLEVSEGSIRFYTYKADGSTIDSRTYRRTNSETSSNAFG